MIATEIGPYRLEEPLGTGGMGEVYRAFDERLERAVAIKRIGVAMAQKSRARERFWREARAIARLSHPGIVQIYDIVDDGENPWIVMELVDGQSLGQLLRSGALTIDAALDYFQQIAEALAEAHGQGILHRDLKSENVMITASGRVKLLDFGLARRLAAGSESRLTAVDKILGTVHALSPEQARSRSLDQRSDLFSFGALLYEALVGEHPFLGADPIATLRQICEESHLPVRALDPQIPIELSRLVDQLLEKEPERRPASAREVAKILGRLRGLVPMPSSPPVWVTEELDETLSEAATAPMARRREVRWAAETSGSSERRQITILHCELTTSSSTSGVLDPEELLEVQPAIEGVQARVAERFAGVVGEDRDHGLRILFGYPRAREDDALRAVQAARELLTEVSKLPAFVAESGLGTRIGIHTGLAVVTGNGGLVLGETAKISVAVSNLAAPGEVLMSDATQEIVAPFVQTETLPPVAISGLGQPLLAFRWLGEREIEPEDSISRRTPMVARRQELELLCDRWQLAIEGTGQVVLLSGEAGIGKTRLLRALYEKLGESATTWLWGRCSPSARNTPFAPIVDLVRRLIHKHDMGSMSHHQALETLARARGLEPEVVAGLVSWLAPADSTSSPSATEVTLAPEARRRKLLRTVLALLQRLAEERPLLMVLEDLHWIDPSTHELLDLLIDQMQSLPGLLVLTFRPGFEPAWGSGHVTRLTLGRLGRRQVGELIRQQAEDRVLSLETEEAIAEKTDGVPLFIEEMTRAVLESAESPTASSDSGLTLAVPTTLQGLLMARLDRLGPAKGVAQQASALGRIFVLDTLVAISPLAEDELLAQLERLIVAEVIFRRGVGASARYTFRHALIRDAAYQSLLRSERRKIHRAIARVFEDGSPEMGESRPEILAQHHTEGGDASRAAALWLRAGEQASERGAFREAIGHLTRGRDQLATLPADRTRDERELGLQIALGTAWMAIEGYAAPPGEKSYRRAHELCRQLGDSPNHFPVLSGLFIYRLTRGEHGLARELAGELLRLAERGNQPDLLLEAHRACGMSLFYRGELEAAREHFERGLELGDGTRDARSVRLYPSDPEVTCLMFAAWSLWIFGHPEQALKQSERGLELARERGHLFSLVIANCLAADLHQACRQAAPCRDLSEAAIAVANEQGFAFWSVIGAILRGWALAAGDDPAAGRAEMLESLEAQRRIGVVLGRTHYLTMLAETCIEDDPEQGLACLDEARALAETNGERCCEAEIHRLRGELLLACGPTAKNKAAEDCFRRALDVARRQGGKTFELRAATSLARLLRDQGKGEAGRKGLATIYGRFDEGFETADLQQARALLAELEPATC